MKFGIRCYYCKTCNKLYAVEEYNNHSTHKIRKVTLVEGWGIHNA